MGSRWYRKMWEYAYGFLDAGGRRKDHGSELKPLAEALDTSKRKRALVLARDMYKESDIFKWAVDFHCNNVTSFAFHAGSNDSGFNGALYDFYRHFNASCDLSGRYTFEQLWDVWEHRKVLDGDVLIVRLDDGRLQTIQSNWLVEKAGEKNCAQGVYLDPFGRTLGYHVERKTTPGQILEYDIPARYALLDAYLQRC